MYTLMLCVCVYSVSRVRMYKSIKHNITHITRITSPSAVAAPGGVKSKQNAVTRKRVDELYVWHDDRGTGR